MIFYCDIRFKSGWKVFYITTMSFYSINLEMHFIILTNSIILKTHHQDRQNSNRSNVHGFVNKSFKLYTHRVNVRSTGPVRLSQIDSSRFSSNNHLLEIWKWRLHIWYSENDFECLVLHSKSMILLKLILSYLKRTSYPHTWLLVKLTTC